MSELMYPEDIRLKIEKEIGFDPREIPPTSGYRITIKIHTDEEFARLPDGTLSAIMRPETTRDHDKFTNCVGMVISMNPACYSDKDRYEKTGPFCSLGDWVIFPRQAGLQYMYKGLHFVDIYEDQIPRRVPSPFIVKRA